MVYPSKVLGFLDLAGEWDPSLAFVMGGAVVVAFVSFRIAGRRGASLSGEPLHLPTQEAIDARLIGGSVIFGVGWGLVGLCPGPAIANLGFLDWRAALFVLCMVSPRQRPWPRPRSTVDPRAELSVLRQRETGLVTEPGRNPCR
jgi:uncharacterized protein